MLFGLADLFICWFFSCEYFLNVIMDKFSISALAWVTVSGNVRLLVVSCSRQPVFVQSKPRLYFSMKSQPKMGSATSAKMTFILNGLVALDGSIVMVSSP